MVMNPGPANRFSGRAQKSLGSTTTDANGAFVLPFDPVAPGTPLAVSTDTKNVVPLIVFKAAADGGASRQDVPLPRPADVSFQARSWTDPGLTSSLS
jgi:hypothetical protein